MGLVTWRYQIRIPIGPDICHRAWLCIYNASNCSRLRTVVYSVDYGTVHYKARTIEVIRNKSRTQSRLRASLYVAILPWLYKKRRKAIFSLDNLLDYPLLAHARFTVDYGFNTYNAELFLFKPWRLKGFFQFQTIMNGSAGSFWFIWISKLWVYGY